MDRRLPLSALLSQLLVAFTIELDNEFEHRMPHGTTDYGATPGASVTPWLCSMVMWTNCIKFVPEGGIRVRELYRLARVSKKNLRTMIVGLRRWGYLRVESATSRSSDSEWRISVTGAGQLAQNTWQPLPELIEGRWRERFGQKQIAELRDALWQVIQELDTDLPDFLPIIGYGLFTKEPPRPLHLKQSRKPDDLPVSALLSKVLLTFAVEFEDSAAVSLAISANVVRVLGKKPVRVRDLPELSGISKPPLAMALGFLARQGYAKVETDSHKTRIATLTQKGLDAQADYHRLVKTIEERWCSRFDEKAVHSLRNSLEQLTDSPGAPLRVLAGIEPYPDGWRAKLPKLQELPHYPTVLHRGGFPDGS